MYQSAKPLFEPVHDGLSELKPQNRLPWKVKGDNFNLKDVVNAFESNFT